MPPIASRITKKSEVRRPQRTAFTLPALFRPACVRCLPPWPPCYSVVRRDGALWKRSPPIRINAKRFNSVINALARAKRPPPRRSRPESIHVPLTPLRRHRLLRCKLRTTLMYHEVERSPRRSLVRAPNPITRPRSLHRVTQRPRSDTNDHRDSLSQGKGQRRWQNSAANACRGRSSSVASVLLGCAA